MAKFIAQIVVLGSQIVGRAFAQALKQEFQSGAATQRASAGSAKGAKQAATNSLMGMTLTEAKQILNIQQFEQESIQKNFDHLFKVNDKKAGGSFYLQSKVVRAKDRLDEELSRIKKDNSSESSSTKSEIKEET